ncbi:hypothetical protein AB0H83_02165 [Dactylosporangium sp. NPDC050688]|uniref:hypothetical protein n=1 Tax=Dactylosporangium sp. NPDC050688 TaxID=3157217 RepID=UPI0033E09FF9
MNRMTPYAYVAVAAKVERILASADTPLSARQVAERMNSTRTAVRIVLQGMRREERAFSTVSDDGSLRWSAGGAA